MASWLLLLCLGVTLGFGCYCLPLFAGCWFGWFGVLDRWCFGLDVGLGCCCWIRLVMVDCDAWLVLIVGFGGC